MTHNTLEAGFSTTAADRRELAFGARRSARPLPRRVGVDPGQRAARRRRPVAGRPGSAPLRYRGSGVAVSRAPHRRPARRVTPLTVLGLGLLAAVITVWLGIVAQVGDAVRQAGSPVPDQLAVVQVLPGETLQHVAARVAPNASVSGVVASIRELNGLDGAAVNAGQTLIAPVG